MAETTDTKSELAGTGLCADCLTGFSFAGTPKGEIIKSGPFETVYVVSEGETKGKPAIVIYTDVFGLGIVNPKLIADKLQEHTGYTVYVPDLFNGKPIPNDAIHLPDTPEEERAMGMWGKAKMMISVVPTAAPWLFRNKPATKIEAVKSMIHDLKNERGHTKIGTIGYCYGAALSARLNIDGLSDATAVAHPSMIYKPDLDNLKTPTRFLLAELDNSFKPDMVEYAKETLAKKGVPAEFTTYPGTCHGYAARGNLAIESVRKGFEGHLIESVEWFKKYLG